MPATLNNLGSDAVDTATAAADPLGPGGDHRVTRKRAAEQLQDAAAALLREGSPSTDTSDLSGSRSDGGSGSRSDGGSNEGSNDVGTTPTIELDSPLASLPHAAHVNCQHLAHLQPTALPFSAPPAAAPLAAATTCLIEQPSAKRAKLMADHAKLQVGLTAPTAAAPHLHTWPNTIPMAAGPPPFYGTVPPKAITTVTERSIRRSLDMAAGSDSQAPSSLAGIQSGAGSNQEGCDTPEQKLVAHNARHFSAAERTGASHGSGTHPPLCKLEGTEGSLEATAPTQMYHQSTANNVGLAYQPLLAAGSLQPGQQQQLPAVFGDTRVQLPQDQLQHRPTQAVQDSFCMDTGTSAWCAAAFDAPVGFLC